MTDTPRQCAWCRKVKGPDGAYAGEPQPLLPTPATHGICPACKRALYAEIKRMKRDGRDAA